MHVYITIIIDTMHVSPHWTCQNNNCVSTSNYIALKLKSHTPVIPICMVSSSFSRITVKYILHLILHKSS